MLLMLHSVSGPKPVCLQQVTVHLDLFNFLKHRDISEGAVGVSKCMDIDIIRGCGKHVTLDLSVLNANETATAVCLDLVMNESFSASLATLLQCELVENSHNTSNDLDL